MLTPSMKLTSCPFTLNQCAGTSTNIKLQPNMTATIALSSATNKYFNSTAVCYYTVTTNLTGMNQSLSMVYVAV